MRRLRQSEAGIPGVDVAVSREVQPRDDVLRIEQRPQTLRFGRIDHARLDAAVIGDIARVSELIGPLWSSRQAQRSGCGEAHVKATELAQPGVEGAPIGRELRQSDGPPGPSDQPGGMPSGPTGESVALAHDDIGHALESEVVGDARADDPAADDDDVCLRWQHLVHICGETDGRKRAIRKPVHDQRTRARSGS